MMMRAASIVLLCSIGALLPAVPGAFFSLGNGAEGEPGGTPLHNGRYDFNDAVLTTGARYFAQIVRQRLPVRAAA